MPTYNGMQKRVSIRTIIINIMLISIFVTIACVNVSPSYADGFVPKSTPDSFPLLDARLIGMPIKKTELATALISYSKAEAELSALTEFSIRSICCVTTRINCCHR